MQKTYAIGERTFVLDQAKAETALAAKRVVGGRETMTFNLLPLRYEWAYRLYRTISVSFGLGRFTNRRFPAWPPMTSVVRTNAVLIALFYQPAPGFRGGCVGPSLPVICSGASSALMSSVVARA